MKPNNSHSSERLSRSVHRHIIWLIAAISALLTSCSHRVVPVQTATHDTIYITQQRHDSIHVRDSIYLHEYQRGETIYIERTNYRELYTDRWLHDTLYQSRTDTIRMVVKEPAIKEWSHNAEVTVAKVLLICLLLAGLGWWLTTFRK